MSFFNNKIAFRCDSSIQMGAGHVMRCLTLADALAEKGAECHFICRKHDGHLLEMIRQRGHLGYGFPLDNGLQLDEQHEQTLAHANWLGSTQQHDAKLCSEILKTVQPDWLVVDHYALDIRWESQLRPYCKKLMVIDDLADRQHDCDILLDQTFGRDLHDYLQWIPAGCQLLCGSHYALLRQEFAQWREYSLERRASGQLEHLLINLGGVDKDNLTMQILKVLAACPLPKYCKITVVMGATAPWTQAVQEQATLMPWVTEVKVGVSNMAELMANSDLAIGAAGSTSWERCSLGLPTIMLVLADNQQQIAFNLDKAHAVTTVSLGTDFELSVLGAVKRLTTSPALLKKMSHASASIIDGLGSNLVIKKMVS